ncbi:hypothetical protein EMCRGX_G003734 [Ephydatia muelleri]
MFQMEGTSEILFASFEPNFFPGWAHIRKNIHPELTNKVSSVIHECWKAGENEGTGKVKISADGVFERLEEMQSHNLIRLSELPVVGKIRAVYQCVGNKPQAPIGVRKRGRPHDSGSGDCGGRNVKNRVSFEQLDVGKELSTWKKPELEAYLHHFQLKKSGNKPDLIKLVRCTTSPYGAGEEYQDSQLGGAGRNAPPEGEVFVRCLDMLNMAGTKLTTLLVKAGKVQLRINYLDQNLPMDCILLIFTQGSPVRGGYRGYARETEREKRETSWTRPDLPRKGGSKSESESQKKTQSTRGEKKLTLSLVIKQRPMRQRKDNLGSRMRRALAALQRQKQFLVFQKADKGSVIVVEKGEDYVGNEREHLAVPQVYQRLHRDGRELAQAIKQAVYLRLRRLHNAGRLTEEEYKYCIPPPKVPVLADAVEVLPGKDQKQHSTPQQHPTFLQEQVHDQVYDDDVPDDDSQQMQDSQYDDDDSQYDDDVYDDVQDQGQDDDDVQDQGQDSHRFYNDGIDDEFKDMLQVQQGLPTDSQFDMLQVQQGLPTDSQFDMLQVQQGLPTDSQFDMLQVQQGLPTDSQLTCYRYSKVTTDSQFDAKVQQGLPTDSQLTCYRYSKVYLLIVNLTCYRYSKVYLLIVSVTCYHHYLRYSKIYLLIVSVTCYHHYLRYSKVYLLVVSVQ